MQIGQTPLIEVEFEGQTVLVQDHSQNPLTHTHKDWRSKHIVQKALASEKPIHTLAMITAGNGGRSLEACAKGTGLNVVLIVDTQIRPQIREALEATSATIVPVNLAAKKLNPKDIMQLAGRSPTNTVWDVTNSFEEGYEPMIEQLPHEPEAIVLPVGGGETYLAAERIIHRLGWNTNLYGVTVDTPDTDADKLYAPYAPARSRINRQPNNGHSILTLSPKQVRWAMEHAPTTLEAEPSAQVVWAAVHELRGSVKNLVVINTGKGIF